MVNLKVTSWFKDATRTVEARSMEAAITEFYGVLDLMVVPIEVVDCDTGELLALANMPGMKDYCSESFADLILDWLMKKNW